MRIMTRPSVLGGLSLALGAVLAAPAAAQEARTDTLAAKVERLEARVDSLVRLVAEMRRESERAAAEARAAPKGEEDDLAALRVAAREAARESAEERPDTAGAAPSRTRNLQILNPEISITGDVVGNYTNPAEGEDNFSAVPREFEFSFQSALDPYTRTKIFFTKEEDFEIAGLGEEDAEEGEEGGEGEGFEIEEGYLYWVGLPAGFGAKIGKFRQEIGLYNRWHNHALLEVERPLATTAFLGEEGLIQTGASFTLPSFSLGPAMQTATLEVTRGNNETLFDGGGEISYLGRLQSFFDLSPSQFLQLGGTGVYGTNGDASLDSRLLGLDLFYRWNPSGRRQSRQLSLKSEWYLAEKDFGARELSGNGGYLQANYRANRRWTFGTRADYVDGFGADPKLFQLAPSVTWWQSEWVRLRLQYNYLNPEAGDDNHTFLLQTVWSVGPHKHETY